MNDTQTDSTESGAASYLPAPVSAPVGPQPMYETDARTASMLVHLIAGISAFFSAGVLGFAGPLIIWLSYRERSALIDSHGKQQLNLQLSQLVYLLGAIVLGIVILFGVGLIATLPLWGLYWLYAVVISFVAAAKANAGEYYDIPLTIKFLK